jgi:hypothetical protein
MLPLVVVRLRTHTFPASQSAVVAQVSPPRLLDPLPTHIVPPSATLAQWEQVKGHTSAQVAHTPA